MKLTNTNISFAIYALINAYKALPDNGFRLHIEDKVLDGIQVAGQKTGGAREISEDELPESVRKALGLGGEISSKIETILQAEKPKLLGTAIAKEALAAAGWDGESWDHIILFYEPLVEVARDMDDMKRLANEYVRHEWRHGCQFNWLRAHGINVMTALMQENETVYGEGPLERDAHLFQWGEAEDIDVAMASFIA